MHEGCSCSAAALRIFAKVELLACIILCIYAHLCASRGCCNLSINAFITRSKYVCVRARCNYVSALHAHACMALYTCSARCAGLRRPGLAVAAAGLQGSRAKTKGGFPENVCTEFAEAQAHVHAQMHQRKLELPLTASEAARMFVSLLLNDSVCPCARACVATIQRPPPLPGSNIVSARVCHSCICVWENVSRQKIKPQYSIFIALNQ